MMLTRTLGQLCCAWLMIIPSLAQAAPSFLEYCQDPNKSAEEQYTIDVLAKKLDRDTCEKLAEATTSWGTLYIFDAKIQDVRAFNYFTNIRELLISSHAHVRAEQLKPSDKLTKVYIHADIDVWPYMGPNVEQMRLRHSKNVDLSNIGRHTKLKELTFENVKTSTDFSGLKNLTKLEMLKIVEANVGTVAHLPVAPRLKTLTLKHAQITDVTGMPELAGLKSLDILGNGFTVMEPLTVLKGLESIDLSENLIADIDCLLDLPHLKVVKANQTGVHDWHFIDKMTQLETLNISGNGVTDYELSQLVNESTPLLNLDISGNEITDLSPLNWFDRIAYVDVSHNAVTRLTRLPDTLWWLIADHNDINDVSEYHGPALRELSLRHNKLVAVGGFGHENDLTRLDLRSNLIEDLMPMKNFCCAENVRLADNPIGTTIEKTEENCPTDTRSRGLNLFCKY